MLLFIVRRLALTLPVLFGLLTLTFVMIHAIPADPAAVLAGDQASPAQIEALRHQYGFDRPIVEQFLIYLGEIGRGSLGQSYVTREPVLTEIAQRLPATLELTLSAMTLAVFIGIPLGLIAALNHNHWVDNLLTVLTVGGLSIAPFLLALILQFTFSMDLNLLPVHGRLSAEVAPPPGITGFYLIDSVVSGEFTTFKDAFLHLILPTIALAVGPLATLTRFTRSAVLTTLPNDFINYGRAAGYPRFILMTKYVLRNSLITPVTQVGLLFGATLAGAVVVESLFDWPGLGSYAVTAIATSDYQDARSRPYR